MRSDDTMEIDLHVHGLVDRDLQEFVLETELPPSSAKTIWSVGKGTSVPSPKTTDVPGDRSAGSAASTRPLARG